MKINIKSNKGVTFTGLVIYISCFFMICAVIGVITTFFFNNTKFLSSEATASAEYDLLNVYMAKEAKTEGNKISSPNEIDSNNASSTNGEKYISFSSNNQYVFEKETEEEYGKIYLKNLRDNKYFIIANYIENARFENNGQTFSIYVKILDKEYTQSYNLAN